MTTHFVSPKMGMLHEVYDVDDDDLVTQRAENVDCKPCLEILKIIEWTPYAEGMHEFPNLSSP